MTTTPCTGCTVQQGTHKPAEAVHEIAEPKTQQPEALRLAEWLDEGWWPSYVPQETAAELRRQHARIAELEAQLATAQPAAQGMDAQTIKHISALGELARMPNAEYFADAHNAAVRHLRALAAQAKHGTQA